MAHHNSDLEIFPKLAEHSKKLMKLEEYLSFVIESTQYWQESKYMVKNEIREVFSALSSILHQREMHLYRQVDELHVNFSRPPLNTSLKKHGSQQGKDSSKSSNLPRKLVPSPSVSPPLKLKFEADVKSLEEVIHSFGCLEIEDGNTSEGDDFIFINHEDGLSMEDGNLSLHRNDLDQNVTEDPAEASSVGSSSDSFEILSDCEASVPRSKNSSNVFHLSLLKNKCEKSDALIQTKSPSVTSSSLCNSVGILPDSKTSVAWLRKDTKHDINVCHTGSVSTVRDIGGTMLSHPSASNGNAKWLRKSDEIKSSRAAVPAAKGIAPVLSFSDAFKAKGNQASVDDFSKLSSHFRSTGKPENNKIATEGTGSTVVTNTMKNRNPYLAVNVPNSNAVLDFTSIISKMLGNENDGWLGRNHSNVVQPLSNHNCNEAVTDTMKQKSVTCLGRTPFETEAVSVHINNTEKSSSPTLLIKKMFSPYFKNQDKNNWLVKNHMSNQMCMYS